MVEGLPGSDFAGVKHYSLNIKAWGRPRCRVVPGPLVCIARCFIAWSVLSRAYFYVLKMCCGNIAGIFSRE